MNAERGTPDSSFIVPRSSLPLPLRSNDLFDGGRNKSVARATVLPTVFGSSEPLHYPNLGAIRTGEESDPTPVTVYANIVAKATVGQHSHRFATARLN
jgi:hypothetical protein